MLYIAYRCRCAIHFWKFDFGPVLQKDQIPIQPCNLTDIYFFMTLDMILICSGCVKEDEQAAWRRSRRNKLRGKEIWMSGAKLAHKLCEQVGK